MKKYTLIKIGNVNLNGKNKQTKSLLFSVTFWTHLISNTLTKYEMKVPQPRKSYYKDSIQFQYWNCLSLGHSWVFIEWLFCLFFREGERNIGPLFHFMHLLADSCMWPDQGRDLQLWHIQMMFQQTELPGQGQRVSHKPWFLDQSPLFTHYLILCESLKLS